MNLSVRLTPSSGGGFGELSKNEIFDILRNERRRYLLHYLLSSETPVELGKLATLIAAWEYDTSVKDVTSTQRKRVYTTLQQTHLPKMDRAEIVDYDSNRGLVRQTEHTDKVNVYLEIVPQHEFPWREYYLALGAVCSAIVTALWVDIYPLTAVPPLAWATVIVVVLTLSSVIHVYSQRRNRLGAGELPPELRD